MKNVTIKWVLPTVRVSGLPLDLSEINGVNVYLSADSGANFTLIDTILVSEAQEVFFPDQDPGNWVVRLVVRDTNGASSAPVDRTYTVADDSAPGVVTNVEVIFS